MKKLGSALVVAVALVLLATAPSHARGRGGSGGHHGGHRGFEGHHGFHGRGGVFIGVGPLLAYPYGWYEPSYPYPPPPAYWYFCPPYDVYYPNVVSCPVPWVPVPAAP